MNYEFKKNMERSPTVENGSESRVIMKYKCCAGKSAAIFGGK
jgi:hypothetical protein